MNRNYEFDYVDFQFIILSFRSYWHTMQSCGSVDSTAANALATRQMLITSVVMGNAKKKNMRRFATIILGLLTLSMTYGQTNLNGLYKGLEEMCETDSLGKKDCFSDPKNPEWKWYHLNYLRINGDSVFLAQSPISKFKEQTLYSVSEGGFYYSSGTIKTLSDSIIFIDLTELHCDNCATQVKIQPDGTYKEEKRRIQIVGKLENDLIMTDNVVYKKENEKKIKTKRKH